MNKQYIYQNFLLLTEKQKELITNINNINELFYNFFKGATDNYKNNCNLLVEDNTSKEQDMTITKRNDGRYVKTISINNVKKYIYGRTKEECKNKFYKIKKQLKKNQNFINKKTYKVKDWLTEWYETFKKNFVSKQTQQEIENIIYEKLKYFHEYNLNEIDTNTIQKYFNKIPKSRPKEKMILYFKASMKKANETGKIKINPFNAFITDKKINNIRPPFTYKEQEQIIKRIKNEDIEIAILIYLLTGLRKQELNYKSIEKDIDYENKTLKAINLKQREDEPQYKIIDLSDKTIELICNNIKNIHALNEEKVYRKFNIILKELNIKGNIHTLRHTFATNCMYIGIPTKIYSKWLGHSTIQITEDIYTGIDKNISKEKINKLYNNLYLNFDN